MLCDPGGKHAIEGILYALTEMLLLRRLVRSIAHRPTTLHDPLLESSERPPDAALRDAETENHSAVGRVLLHIAHQFERDGPGPRNGDKGETALVEGGLQHSILVLGRGIEDRIVSASLLAAIRQK